MKIALYAGAFPPSTGGVQTAVVKLAEEWTKAGHQVVVITGVPAPPGEDSALAFPVERYSLQRMPLWSLPLRASASLIQIIVLLLRFRPDIAYLHFLPTNALLVAVAARLTGTPVVISGRGADLTTMPSRSRVHFTALRILNAFAAGVALCSEELRADVRFILPALAARAAVIDDGADLEAIDQAPRLARSTPYIAAVGRLVHKKGFDLLIGALALLPRSCRPHVLVVGDGPERSALELSAVKLGVQDQVEFMGSLDRQEALSVIKTADFVVVPSRAEPFGIVAVEALGARVPVLATNVGHLKNVVRPHVVGLLVDADEESIAKGIQDMYEAKAQWPLWGAQGREIVEASSTWKHVARRALTVLAAHARSRS